jgi:hypothetical protein
MLAITGCKIVKYAQNGEITFSGSFSHRLDGQGGDPNQTQAISVTIQGAPLEVLDNYPGEFYPVLDKIYQITIGEVNS